MTGRTGFSLRRGGPEDLAAIMPLVADLHAGEGTAMPPGAAEAAVARLLATPEFGVIWVIEAEGGVIGYAAVAYGFSIIFGGRDGFLDEFCIAPGWRGRGVGRAALAQIAERLSEDGVKALHLEVNRDNPRAEALYAALGFHLRDGYHLMTREMI